MLRFELVEIDPLDGGVGFGGDYGGSGSLVLNEYIAPKVKAVTGELWMSFIDDPSKKPFKVADVAAGQKLQIPAPPDVPVRLYLVSNDPSGRKTVVNLNAARTRVIAVNKETQTPNFTQNGAAENTRINFTATGYSVAKFRKIQYADDETFTTGLVETVQGNDNAPLPAEFSITRAADANAKEVKTRIAHSTNNFVFGAWSEVKPATFADAGGDGGTGGGLPPTNLYGFRSGMNVDLSWTPGGTGDVSIIINGMFVDTAPDAQGYFTYTFPGPGYYEIYVANDDGYSNPYTINVYGGGGFEPIY